jgi:DNA replication protein DnaC
MTLTGEAGTGKTCAALCVLDHVQARRYWTMPALCEELIAVQNGEKEYGMQPDTLRRWWGRYPSLDCVVVDELGSRERVSDFHYEVLQRAIDLRYAKPTIFISNLRVSDLAKVYDDRIASRLAGGTIIQFPPGDRRLEQ